MDLNNPFVLGITGLCRSGKDTFCKLLSEKLLEYGVTSKRLALADKLKSEIRPALLEKYSIDVFNCSPEEKEIIRPDLVAFGKIWRETSKGTHWCSIVEKQFLSLSEDVVIVPDIRYSDPEYPDDEVSWVKNKHKGILVHVARYKTINGIKEWLAPPNDDERRFDPIMRQEADFSLSWETLEEDELKLNYGGFLNTIAIVILRELESRKRRL